MALEQTSQFAHVFVKNWTSIKNNCFIISILLSAHKKHAMHTNWLNQRWRSKKENNICHISPSPPFLPPKKRRKNTSMPWWLRFDSWGFDSWQQLFWGLNLGVYGSWRKLIGKGWTSSAFNYGKVLFLFISTSTSCCGLSLKLWKRFSLRRGTKNSFTNF